MLCLTSARKSLSYIADSFLTAIFGANFQSVSVAEKSAGYNASTLAPNPNLAQAMQYLDGKLGALITTMKAAKTYNSTLLILTVSVES